MELTDLHVKARLASDPSRFRYAKIPYRLAPGDSFRFEVSAARVLSHASSTDQGGTLGVQIKLGENADAFHTVNGDLIKLGLGIDVYYLSNNHGSQTITGFFLVSQDPDFMVQNIYNAIVRGV